MTMNRYAAQMAARARRVAAVSVVLALAGCGGEAGDAGDPAETDASDPGTDIAGEEASFSAPDGLADTRWRLVEFQSMDDATGTVRPTDRSAYTMELAADGSVALGLDCNRGTGSWTAEPGGDGTSGRFELGPLATTGELCPEPSMGEQLASQAQYIRSYLLRDGRLYLSLMADGGIYVWEPDSDAPPATAPEDGGPRDWEVATPTEMREQPSGTASSVASLDAGMILDNLGCESAADGVWCDVQPLGGGPRGYVDVDALAPAVSPDGSVAVGPDDSALRAGQGDFDATGNIPCAQTAGQPLSECAFGVARAGGGYATVVVTRPDGRQRAIYFRLGRAIGGDTSEADPGGAFEATKEADLHRIRIGAERYEIPEAVILGG